MRDLLDRGQDRVERPNRLWVSDFTHVFKCQGLLALIGNLPPAEAEVDNDRQTEPAAWAA